MSEERYKGRAERRVRHILSLLFDTVAHDQYHTKHLVSEEEYLNMADDLKKYWDAVLKRMVIEINYKHTSHAQKKWDRFVPHLIQNKWIPVTIQDEYCPNLFQGNKYMHHDSWDDWIEVINELKRNGINEKGEKRGEKS